MAVDPLTSQKTTVTVFRTSRGVGAATSSAPQFPQNRKPSGFWCSQLGQIGTERVYDWIQRDA